MLAHRARVQAHLVGTWQERLAGMPVNYYYYYYIERQRQMGSQQRAACQAAGRGMGNTRQPLSTLKLKGNARQGEIPQQRSPLNRKATRME